MIIKKKNQPFKYRKCLPTNCNYYEQIAVPWNYYQYQNNQDCPFRSYQPPKQLPILISPSLLTNMRIASLLTLTILYGWPLQILQRPFMGPFFGLFIANNKACMLIFGFIVSNIVVENFMVYPYRADRKLNEVEIYQFEREGKRVAETNSTIKACDKQIT